jgi:purine-binding chemotaxis protein CheW
MTTIAADPLQTQYLTFCVGDEEYGVGILQAKEIIEYDTVTTVPNAPRFIRGVINLRGSVVPVVDLAVKFGRIPSPVTRRSCIVVVEVQRDGQRNVMGIAADRVSQVAELAPGTIEPAPDFGTGVRSDWLQGLGRSDKRFILLLNTDRVLTTEEQQTLPGTTTNDTTELPS